MKQKQLCRIEGALMNFTTRLEIEHACTRCAIDYSHKVDFGDFEGFANLFAENGVLSVGSLHLDSRANIGKAMSQRPAEILSRHVITNIAINVIDEEAAVGMAYFMLYRTIVGNENDPTAVPPVAVVGHYKDKFEKTTDGWKFAERIGVFDMIDTSQFG